MTPHGIVRKAVILAVSAIAVAGCGSDPEPASPTTRTSTATSTAPSQPGSTVGSGVSNTPATARPTPSQPTQSPPAQAIPPRATGTATIVTRTQALHPVPNVPVNLRLVTPCDPAAHDIPVEGVQETQRFTGTTDATGRAVFTVPVGCYRMGMGQPPAGTRPVPEGMHTLFVTRAGEAVEGSFRFQDAGWPPVCSTETIVNDLAAGGELYAGQADPALAQLRDCEGTWGVISWNTPGDTQRIVHHNFERWTTYVAFPHDTCWTEATRAGVPERLRPYFNC